MLIPAGRAAAPCVPSEHSLALWLPAEVGQVWLQSLCWSLQPCLECPFVTQCLSVLQASELRALGGHNCVYFVVFLCVTSLHFHFSFPVEPCFPLLSPSVPCLPSSAQMSVFLMMLGKLFQPPTGDECCVLHICSTCVGCVLSQLLFCPP